MDPTSPPGRGPSTPRSPKPARARLERLLGRKHLLARQSVACREDLERKRAFLAISPRVTEALEKLNENLFQQVLQTIGDALSLALQEVLEEPLRLRAKAEWKRNAASVDFWVERDGEREDILRGQGGSVANILSVGLRMFALTTLDEAVHRRFLVLDEQDCWIRPDLVPRLVRIVRDAGATLGFQILMISHHDEAVFDRYADRIYRFTPTPGGVRVEPVAMGPACEDLGG